jgi:hypothetical protein
VPSNLYYELMMAWLSIQVVPVTYGGVDVYIHIVLTTTLAGGEWSASRLGRFTTMERAPGTHWKGGSVGSKTGFDDVEKSKFLTLPGLEP